MNPPVSPARGGSGRRVRALLAGAAALALTLGLAACGDDGDDEAAPAGASSAPAAGAGTFPVTVLSGPLDGGTELTIESRPEAIISLSPSATETLFAIGAGDQVIAVDDQSDYPENVPTTDLSGFQPNIEAILGYSPDLVIASDDVNNLVAGLSAAGVPTLLMPAPADLDEAYSQMERLGAATGHVAEAAALVAEVSGAVTSAVEKIPDVKGLTYYHELDASLYTITSDTFIGQLYAEFGLTSIADAAAAGGDQYPQLSAEYIVEADPDLVVLTDAEFGDVTVETARQRPGWDGISAVRTGHIVDLDPDIASRWGPRLADFAELIGEQVATLQPAAS